MYCPFIVFSDSPASSSLCSLICTFLYMTHLSPASLQVPFFKPPIYCSCQIQFITKPFFTLVGSRAFFIYGQRLNYLNLSVGKMPNSTIIHATFFAVGALVGGSVAAAVSTNKRLWPSRETPGPVVEVGPSGKAQISDLTSPVLRYGNPGACKHHLGSIPHHF
jgi:hypothetical protein